MVESSKGTCRKHTCRVQRRHKHIPLLICPDGEEPLLGLTTFEVFRLKVNPITQNFEPARFIEYAST